MNFLISRHAGAIAWCQQQGIRVDCILAHLADQPIATGDVVIGTLPIHIAAAIQAQGARYLHLSLEMPFAWRGQELTCEQMAQAGACLQEFQIIPVPRTEACHPANHGKCAAS